MPKTIPSPIARQPLPTHGQDALAEFVELGRKVGAIAIDEKQRDQHEQQIQCQVEETSTRRQNGLVDVIDVRPADHRHILAQRARRADIEIPLLYGPIAYQRQCRKPVRSR
jgi:hypothetical protein